MMNKNLILISIIGVLIIGAIIYLNYGGRVVEYLLAEDILIEDHLTELDAGLDINTPIFFYYFYSPACPFCDKAEVFLSDLENRIPELEIRKINAADSQNIILMRDISVNNFNLKGPLSVPTMFIGEQFIIGLPSSKEEVYIENAVKRCLDYGCPNPQTVSPQRAKNIKDLGLITLPIIGEINIAEMAFPLVTIVLGAADGFNPCALWILLFLISIIVVERSRKKMIAITGTFILVSGIFYFFLITAWLKLFLAIGYIDIVKIIIGLAALSVGLFQIRSFIKQGSGICKIAPAGTRIHNKILQKAKQIIVSKSLLLTILGIALLAVAVNFVEFLCSAGIPAIFTFLLSLQEFLPLYNYLFILLYVFVFLLDEIIIFSIALIFLKVTNVAEKFAKWVTLIGGLLMLLLGIILLFKPNLLIF